MSWSRKLLCFLVGIAIALLIATCTNNADARAALGVRIPATSLHPTDRAVRCADRSSATMRPSVA